MRIGALHAVAGAAAVGVIRECSHIAEGVRLFRQPAAGIFELSRVVKSISRARELTAKDAIGETGDVVKRVFTS